MPLPFMNKKKKMKFDLIKSGYICCPFFFYVRCFCLIPLFWREKTYRNSAVQEILADIKTFCIIPSVKKIALQLRQPIQLSVLRKVKSMLDSVLFYYAGLTCIPIWTANEIDIRSLNATSFVKQELKIEETCTADRYHSHIHVHV